MSFLNTFILVNVTTLTNSVTMSNYPVKDINCVKDVVCIGRLYCFYQFVQEQKAFKWETFEGKILNLNVLQITLKVDKNTNIFNVISAVFDFVAERLSKYSLDTKGYLCIQDQYHNETKYNLLNICYNAFSKRTTSYFISQSRYRYQN